MFKVIPNFTNICINECGDVYNQKTGKRLTPYKSKQGYLYIKCSDEGVLKRVAIHRAVAMSFCKGYDEELVVDHIDGNKENNYYKNLRWVTQKDNINKGYERRKDTPFRNYNVVGLYYKGEFVNSFWSVTDGSRYASKKYGCSYSMLVKHYKNKDVELRKM